MRVSHLISVVFFAAWAAFAQTPVAPSGTGTSADPYKVSTLENLAWISATNSSWSSHFVQTANIDASATAGWDDGKGFAPIGDSTTRFSGIYQGKGYTIKGLTIDRTAENHVGLFGYTDSTAIVDSLSLVGYSVKGKNSIGGLVGYNSGSVSGSYSNGLVSGHDFIGGLVGGSTGIVSNSYSSGTVTGRDYVGGLVGGSTAVLNNSYSTSAVKGLNRYSGGLLGLQMNGTVNNCYSIGSVTGKFVVGGLVGYNVNAEVSNSYSTGVVTGTSDLGGLMGINNGTVTDCYWDVESSGTATGIGKDDNSQSVTGLTTAKMKQKSSFVGWDFSTIWRIDEGMNYPKLSAIILMTDGVKPSGKGTSADPYQIKTLSNLAWISATNSSWSSHFVQTANIDASATAEWDAGKGFAPIGSESTPFSGSYHGKGYTIKGLTINRSDEVFTGLFGRASLATVDSLGIVECSITGRITVGALLGAGTGGTVSHCYSTGSIKGMQNVAGLIGVMMDGGTVSHSYSGASVMDYGSGMVAGLIGVTHNSTVSHSFSTGSVTGENVAGLVGENLEGSTVIYSYSTGTVTGTDAAGGLVAYNKGDLINSYSTGSVTGEDIVGGLVGDNYGVVSNSYSTGSVTGEDIVGGLVGDNYGVVSNSYSTGSVTGTKYVGGLVGYNDSTVTGCYWDVESSGTATGIGDDDNSQSVTGLTTAKMKQKSSFVGWDFSTIWRIDEGMNYPKLSAIILMTDGVKPSGKGTSADPYQIKTLSNLAWISATNSSWSSHFVQTANIDASSTAEWDAGKGFAPIGDATTRFSGIYQGKGYTIKGLTINLPEEDNIGLFGYTDSTAIVDSLGVVESSITGNYSVGALIGYNGNGTVTHCYSSGSVTGDEDFGGLIGVNEGSVVSSYSTSDVTGNNFGGGLVGTNIDSSEVKECYSTGSVEALVQDAGGLVGYNEGDLINSYSTGSVTGENFVGGLVGDNWGVVSNSYSTGSVTGTFSVGGLVGYNDSTVTSCYWDVESSGTATGIGKDDNSQSVTGLTTAKMKQKSSFVGWDFSTIWSIKEGVSYPKLRIFEDESQSISPYLAINTGSLKPVAGGVEISGVRGRLDLYNISGARLTTLNVTSDGFYPLQQQPGLYILRGAGQSWKVLQK